MVCCLIDSVVGYVKQEYKKQWYGNGNDIIFHFRENKSRSNKNMKQREKHPPRRGKTR